MMRTSLMSLLLLFAGVVGCASEPQPQQKKPPVEVPTTNATIIADCDAGSPGSCLQLGLRYERGENINKDMDAAFAYYDKACKLGSSHGCYSKALVLLNDRENPIRALPILEYTCDVAKHGPSCVELGDLARDGVIFPRDEEEALKRYGQACDTGYHVGCNAYIRHLWTASKQLVGLKDFVKFLQTNCSNGHEMSCTEMAKLYDTGAQWAGETLAPDKAKAAEYREMLSSARRTHVVVDSTSKPPPTDMKVEDVAPKAPTEPFQPGYIVVSGADGQEIFVDGVDTGKKAPATVTIVKGGRHAVQVQSKDGKLTNPKLAWISSGQRVELIWE